jgi:hypothetical protein
MDRSEVLVARRDDRTSLEVATASPTDLTISSESKSHHARKPNEEPEVVANMDDQNQKGARLDNIWRQIHQ